MPELRDFAGRRRVVGVSWNEEVLVGTDSFLVCLSKGFYAEKATFRWIWYPATRLEHRL